MKARFIIILALLAVMLSACSLAEDITPPPDYQSPTPAPTMSPLFPQTAPDLAVGAAIYAEKCAPCHGDAGLGDGPMAAQLQKPPAKIGSPELARAAAPVNWYTTVTEGNIGSFMPPFKTSLSDQQRWDVVAYTLSLGGSTAAEAKAGQVVYEANCAQCHGATGNAVQNADLSDQALMAKLTQNDIASFINKGVGMMPGFSGMIPDEQIFAAAAYVRTFTVAEGVAVAMPTATAMPQATATPAGASSDNSSLTPTPEGTPQATATPAVVTGSISGKITNGSGGNIPAGQKVVLHTFSHDATTQQFSEVGSTETTLSADGTYSFKKVEMPATYAFYISVEFSGAVYESQAAFASDGQTDIDLPLTVYDTTTDASVLQIDQAHVLLDYSTPDVVQVVEFLIVSNPGTKSVVSTEKDGPVLNVPLPVGYSNLQFEQGSIGNPYIQTSDGFADVTSVAPGSGQYQLVFAVDLPLPKAGLLGGRTLKISQLMPLKVNKLSVLVPEGISIADKGFTKGESQDMGTGVKYQVYSSGALDAGQSLNITASGSPSAGTAGGTSDSTSGHQNIIIGVGVFGLALVLVGAWLFWRDRKRAEEDDEDEDDGDDEADNHDSEEIINAIVALDDQFKAGNIQEDAYNKRRAELKAKLKEIL